MKIVNKLNKKMIAITGGICTGKSYISKIIKNEYFYDVYNVDNIVKELYKQKKIKYDLVDIFSEQILLKNEVNTEYILNNILVNKILLSKLNNYIHPLVKKKIINIKKNNNKNKIFFEIPLLFETDLYKWMDIIILIISKENLRIRRGIIDRKMNFKNLMLFFNIQSNQYDNISKSDFIIINNENEQYLKKQIYTIMENI